jgi:hypothetical protein
MRRAAIEIGELANWLSSSGLALSLPPTLPAPVPDRPTIQPFLIFVVTTPTEAGKSYEAIDFNSIPSLRRLFHPQCKNTVRIKLF